VDDDVKEEEEEEEEEDFSHIPKDAVVISLSDMTVTDESGMLDQAQGRKSISLKQDSASMRQDILGVQKQAQKPKVASSGSSNSNSSGSTRGHNSNSPSLKLKGGAGFHEDFFDGGEAMSMAEKLHAMAQAQLAGKKASDEDTAAYKNISMQASKASRKEEMDEYGVTMVTEDSTDTGNIIIKQTDDDPQIKKPRGKNVDDMNMKSASHFRNQIMTAD
jgi:hypothetical protein